MINSTISLMFHGLVIKSIKCDRIMKDSQLVFIFRKTSFDIMTKKQQILLIDKFFDQLIIAALI